MMNTWLELPPRVQVVWHAGDAMKNAAGNRIPFDPRATLPDAPARFSATSYVCWCFAKVGIVLEDDILSMVETGERIIGSSGLDAADLIFRTGRMDRYRPRQVSQGVGHVGIYTGEGTVLHASPYAGFVHEDSIVTFLDLETGLFRGVRRIIPRT
jgi:hypothetical protein